MTLEEFIKRDSVIDLSFFNFSNAITAAYFASNELEVLRVNRNFKKFHRWRHRVLGDVHARTGGGFQTNPGGHAREKVHPA